MSGLLLDTHAALWYLEGNAERMPQATRARIENWQGDVAISTVSLWEIAIKSGLGKLRADPDLPQQLEAAGLQTLPITPAHAWAVRDLPQHHRDPFDRLLIVQCRAEQATLLTCDDAFDAYQDVVTAW